MARSTLRTSTPSGTESTHGAKLRMLVTPAATSCVGDRLGGGGRGGDHADRDGLLGGDPGQLVDVPDDQAVDLLADPGRVGVEQRDDPEAAAGEAVVAGQGVTEVTDADQGDRPALGEPEHVLDLVDQQGDVVADAPGAVRAEVGQVLAQLGRVDPGRGGEASLETVSCPASARLCSARRYSGSRAMVASGRSGNAGTAPAVPGVLP